MAHTEPAVFLSNFYRMRMRFLVPCVFLLISTFLHGQYATFHRIFHGDSIGASSVQDQISDVVTVSDGSYAMIGTRIRYYGSSSVGWGEVTRLGLIGDTIWRTDITEAIPGPVRLQAMVETSDGGFAVTGWVGQPAKMRIWKLSASGALQWAKGVNTNGSGAGFNLVETNDSGFVVVGSVDIPGPFGSYDSDKACVIRTNQNGDTLWTRLIKDPATTYTSINNVAVTSNGDIVVAGTSLDTVGWDNSTSFLLKMSDAGNLLWAKSYQFDGRVNPRISCVVLPGDSLAFLTSDTTSFFQLVKTNPVGDTVWTRSFRQNSALYIGGLIFTSNHRLVCAVSDGPAYSSLLFGFNLNGDVVLARSYGLPPNPIYLGAAAECADGGFLIGGHQDELGSYDNVQYLVKTDPNGISGCYEGPVNDTLGFGNVNVQTWTPNITSGMTLVAPTCADTHVFGKYTSTSCITVGLPEVVHSVNGKVFPNPAIDHFAYKTRSSDPKNYMVVLRSMQGQIVRSSRTRGTSEVRVMRQGLESGMYVCTVTADGVPPCTFKVIFR